MDIAGIRLRGVCKTFHFDCTGVSVRKGDFAVVQTERGVALGEVVQRIDGYEPKAAKPPASRVLRPASAEDVRIHQETPAANRTPRRSASGGSPSAGSR
jgi:cell fate regulator YaaT (PSP1 superfamily)